MACGRVVAAPLTVRLRSTVSTDGAAAPDSPDEAGQIRRCLPYILSAVKKDRRMKAFYADCADRDEGGHENGLRHQNGGC
jgi:hypothetical protein